MEKQKKDKKDKKDKDRKTPNLVIETKKAVKETALWGVSLEEAAKRSDPLWMVPTPISYSVSYLLSNEKCIFSIFGFLTKLNFSCTVAN